MDIPGLEGSIKSLENTLDAVGFWLTISTFVVVVGLIVEYWHEVSALIKQFRIRPPFPWKTLMTMLGGVLVTIGVTGELWFQSNGSRIEEELRSKNHQVVAILSKQTEDSKVLAETLAGENIGLGKKVDRVTTAARAREAELKKENLATEQRLEDERKTRLEMEASLAPRYLWAGTGTHDISPLRAYEGVQVEMVVIQDAEAIRAADELASVLSSAKWKVVGPPTIELGSNIPDGVTITKFFSRSKMPLTGERPAKGEVALLDFLDANGWDANEAMFRPDEGRADNTLLISVGMKPNPYFEPDWLKKRQQYVKQRKLEIRNRVKEMWKSLPR
jgi:hypothetical protein